jgi:hypothetical protein
MRPSADFAEEFYRFFEMAMQARRRHALSTPFDIFH